MRNAMPLIVILLLAAACAAGQTPGAVTNTTRISGKVTDLDGAPLVGISITVKNLKTEEQVTIRSNKNGRFLAEGLKQGDYSVAVEPPLVPGPKGIRLKLDPAEPTPRAPGAKTPVPKQYQAASLAVGGKREEKAMGFCS